VRRRLTNSQRENGRADHCALGHRGVGLGGAFERQALADDPTDDPFGQQLKSAYAESTPRLVVEAPLDPTAVTARSSGDAATPP
jgi:hypothetical protein